MPPVSSVAESTQRSMQAEHEADRKIAEAQKRSDDAIKKIDVETERMRDVYEKRSENEQNRREMALQKQQMETYENLKNIRQEKQREIQKTREKGEAELTHIQETVGNSLEDTERQSRHKQLETEAKLQDRLTQTEVAGVEKIKLTKESADRTAQQLHDQKEARMAELSGDAEGQYQKTKENYNRAGLEANDRFERNYQEKLTDHESQYQNLSHKVVESISALKKDSTDKLASYSQRNEDPFYRLMTTNAEIQENKDSYVLTAEIPPHEQNSVVVSIQGNQVVVSGNRRNKEELTLSPGRKQSTAAFQSFSETFPLNGPVDPKGVIREYSDGVLIVRIPKKSTYGPTVGARRLASNAPPRVDHPQFPDNLPNIQPAPSTAKPLSGQS